MYKEVFIGWFAWDFGYECIKVYLWDGLRKILGRLCKSDVIQLTLSDKAI